ncbi:MAG: DUF4281 domain-containing protein [Limimaricola sp.]|uniref:abscisic acid-deficient protein Aba4 family protein n=1 Tax=Limimaricola sp. TaxID=2211665 RepID=UPI001D4086A2|nr:abscisic acid-deficient protein Aba4 family protein [Limimaricola sp.]MBI1415863.1 DUF4281 domain-containing protein [Limimaricola sp.]
MTPDALFSLAGTLALPGWAILIFAPRRWPALNAVPAVVLPLVLSAGYTLLILAYFAGAGGDFSLIAGVRQLFMDDYVLVAGWVHYLAFDMIVGALAAGLMDRAGIGRIVQAFVLGTVFLFGPLGYLLARSLVGALGPMGLLARTFQPQEG